MSTEVPRARVPHGTLERARATRVHNLFDTLYQRQAGRILAMMLRLSGSRFSAEDLTQETFLRAWRSLASFRGECEPATWLRVIALRVWAEWSREGGRDAGLAGVDPDALYLETITAVLPETRLDLEAAIARLPTKMREALVLHYLDDYTIEETAQALGRARGTVKAQLHAAREHLRRSLA